MSKPISRLLVLLVLVAGCRTPQPIPTAGHETTVTAQPTTTVTAPGAGTVETVIPTTTESATPVSKPTAEALALGNLTQEVRTLQQALSDLSQNVNGLKSQVATTAESIGTMEQTMTSTVQNYGLSPEMKDVIIQNDKGARRGGMIWLCLAVGAALFGWATDRPDFKNAFYNAAFTGATYLLGVAFLIYAAYLMKGG